MKTKTPSAAFALSAALALLILTAGCGRKNDAPASSTTPSATPALQAAREKALAQKTATPAVIGLPNYSRPGSQLSEFGNYILSSYKKFEPVFDAPEYKDRVLAMRAMPLVSAVGEFSVYDGLKPRDADDKSGKLMMSDMQGKRARKGDEIHFEGTHTQTENTSMSKAGDIDSQKGVLNMKRNTSATETKETRGSSVRSRIVSEIAILPDKTLVAQIYIAKLHPLYEDRISSADIHLYRVNADTGLFESYQGKMKTPAMDFTYESILGKPESFAPQALAERLIGDGLKILVIKDSKIVELK